MTAREFDDRERADGVLRGADAAGLWSDRPGGPPPWERDLDALVAPALLTEPSPAVQQAILAAVLAAAPLPQASPASVAPAALTVAPARPLPLAAYLLVAAVLVAYVAAMSWVQGAFGGAPWLATLVAQLVAAGELLVGRPAVGEPLAVAWQVLHRAPWLMLLPVAWLLWERDRASARAA